VKYFISVIVPIYNVEPYLKECLESIIRQTLPNIEIVCVNDGSTDRSLEIGNHYADLCNRLVILDGPNGGYGKAMNRGLDVARGEYIGIVEPDDHISPLMYEDLYKAAEENGTEFVKADFYRFTRSNSGDMNLQYFALSQQQSYYGRVLCPGDEQETFRFHNNTWNGLYRRDFIEKYSIRHNETPGASFQDNGFWFQTFSHAEHALFINKPYYRCRRDNPNSSVMDGSKVYCIHDEYAFIKDFLLSYEGYWERYKKIYTYAKISNYFGTLNRIALEHKEEYVHNIRLEIQKDKENGFYDPSLYIETINQRIMLLLSDEKAFYEYYCVTKDSELPGLRRRLTIINKQLYSTKLQEANLKSENEELRKKLIKLRPETSKGKQRELKSK
jgi:glycosyltransferase involved in cell wall biosynthesis